METDDEQQLRALTLAVEELRAAREEDRMLIEQLQITLVAGAGSSGTGGGGTTYLDWISWVEEWLTVRISRRQQRIRWCRQYAEHPEVADRLEALWHAWEAQWPEPELRLSWFRDGLDHQLPIIAAEDGPLRECSAHEGVHGLPPPLKGYSGR